MRLLENPIRPYPWGSPTKIPGMLGVPPSGEPQAELWMGAHPGSPSTVIEPGPRGSARTLPQVITADPQAELGAAVRDAFGDRLPFLLKLLAAAAPLSLQAHPDPEQARAGFERENAAGIALDAPDRNYKDPYAKPEMICALEPLEALVGFRPFDEVERDVAELGAGDLLTPFLAGGVQAAFTGLLELPPGRRAALVAEVLDRATGSGPAAALVRRLAAASPGDPGVLAALLLNQIVLRPGEAVFLPAGNLHAYLSGFGVELLANSDNVLRGGLTGKHIDIPELLSVLDFTPGHPTVLRPKPEGRELVFDTPAREFRMAIATPTADAPVELSPRGPQILLCTEGAVTVEGDRSRVELKPGRSVYASATDGAVRLIGDGRAFRATVGL